MAGNLVFELIKKTGQPNDIVTWWGVVVIAMVVLGMVLYTGAIGGRGTTIKKADHPIIFAVGVLVLAGVAILAVFKALGRL